MPFNINNFKSQITSWGYLPTNKFEVYVTPPSALFGGNSLIGESGTSSASSIASQLKFRSEFFIAPNVTLEQTQNNRYGVGPLQKTPFTARFDTPINLVFFADKYSLIWQFWHQWLEAIFGFSGTDSGNQGTINASGRYSSKYKDDYSTDITLVIYDNEGNISQRITYTQAFPFTVNDVALSWGESHQLLRINVGLSFTDYTIVGSSLS